jgi:hypothetical protein
VARIRGGMVDYEERDGFKFLYVDKGKFISTMGKYELKSRIRQ